MRFPKVLTLGAIGLALVASACTIQQAGSSTGSAATGSALGQTGPTLPATNEPIAAVASLALPAVVNVTSDVVTNDGRTGQGVGTGFVVRSDGIVVTNCHVVEGATEDHRLLLRREARPVRRARDRRRLRARPGGPQDRRRRPPDARARQLLGPRARPACRRDRLRARAGGRPHRHDRHRVLARPDGPGAGPQLPGLPERRPDLLRRRSRPTPRSTTATPAARCSTCRARWSASTPPATTAPRTSALPSRSTPRRTTIQQADRHAARGDGLPGRLDPERDRRHGLPARPAGAGGRVRHRRDARRARRRKPASSPET